MPHPQQTVKIAIDCETGELLAADALLALSDAEFTALRREAMAARRARSRGDSEAVRFQCAVCKHPVYLSRRVSGLQNRWFVHDGKSTDCPWYEGNHLTPDQIKGLIYRGQQEGLDHRNLKLFLANWLSKTEDVTAVSQEQTTFGAVVKGEWRRPDVKCLYRGQPLVFEIQLSYTFLSEVIARDEFYRREGIFIIWVFARFELNRAAVSDEAFFNHRNLFVLDVDATNQTLNSDALTFNIFHQTPRHRGKHMEDVWTNTLVNLHQVTFPSDTLRPYFFNYEVERQKLEAVFIERQILKQHQDWVTSLNYYINAAIRYCESQYSDELKVELLAEVDQLKDHCYWHDGLEVMCDERFYGCHSVLAVLLSIRQNMPIGYRLNSVFQVIEVGLRSGRRDTGKHAFAILFLWAYKVYKPDVNEKNHLWLTKFAHKIKESLEAGEDTYRRYDGYDQVIGLLFPELKSSLASRFGLPDSVPE